MCAWCDVRFTATELPGVFVVDLEPHADERGYFARVWCPKEFASHGLNPDMAQVSVSSNRRRGTIRGLHYQADPHAEAKLVRVTRGAIWDVAVDLRRTLPSYRKWTAVELTDDNRRMLYIPEGCAHGFQTLTNDAQVTYHISAFFEPTAGRGARYDDPTLGISWPLAVSAVSDRDRTWPDLPSALDPSKVSRR